MSESINHTVVKKRVINYVYFGFSLKKKKQMNEYTIYLNPKKTPQDE